MKADIQQWASDTENWRAPGLAWSILAEKALREHFTAEINEQLNWLAGQAWSRKITIELLSIHLPLSTVEVPLRHQCNQAE